MIIGFTRALSTTNKTLSGSPGAYALTGTAANLTKPVNKLLTAAASSYALTGTAATVLAFTPASITGKIGWWDASVAASFTFNSGSNISAVADQSGNSSNMAKAGSSNWPAYQATGLNSRPCIQFTATSIAALQCASFAMGTGNTLTVWYVGTLAQAGSNGFARYFSYSALPGTNDDWNYAGSWSFNTNSPASATAFNFQRNSISAAGTGNASPAVNRIILTIDSSGHMTAYVNGVSAATATSTGNWVSGGTIGWGRNGYGNFNYATCQAQELGVATSYADATTVGKLDTYLKNKWGL